MTWQQYNSGQCLSDYFSMMCNDQNPNPFDDYKFAAQSINEDFNSSIKKDFDSSINDRSVIKPVDEIDFNDQIVDPKGCMYRCCRWEWYATQGDDVWLIQNSWGTGWGDNGFIRLKNESGSGVSGMNTHIRWVTVV